MNEVAVTLPFLMEEELIRSYIVRTAFLSGYPSVQLLWKLLSGANSPPQIAYPTGLDRLGQALGMDDGHVLLRNNTGVPAYRFFSNPRLYARTVDFMRGSETRGKVVSPTFNRDGNHYALRYCPKCAVRDLRVHGISYFRRYHCVPGVLACPIHKCALTLGCVRCATCYGESNKPWLPSATCRCGNLAAPCVPERLLIEPFVRVAKTIHRFLLADDTDIVSRQVVGATYQRAMVELGISDTECLGEQLIERYGQDVLDLLNVKVDGAWAKQVVQCQSPPIGLARNSVLIDFLFGSYGHFVRSSKRIEIDFSDVKLGECKNIVLREVKGQPGYGSRQVSRRFPDEYAFVRRFDGAWLRGILYPRNYTRPYSKRRKIIDDALLLHMKEKLSEICEENCRPIKITRQRLVHGFKSPNHILSDIRLYPQSAAFIDRFVETSEHYICRLARYLWLAGETACQIRQATGLRLADAASLARGPFPKKGQEPTYVLQAIQNRRLSRQKIRYQIMDDGSFAGSPH